MADFFTPIDIANRALQHTGTPRIVTFADDSKAAAAVSFCYDKVRRAELRRNAWAFATRRTILRAYDPTCVQPIFPAWDATKTYVPGSVVSYNNLLYEANEFISINQEPDLYVEGTTSTPYLTAPWSLYFGPMMITQWALQQTASGPQLWSSTTSYAANFAVVGSDGNQYYSLINGNIGDNPVTDGGVHWQFVGSAAVGPGYYVGELVYYPVGANPGVYRCMQAQSGVQPNVINPWVSSQLYARGQTVTLSSVTYQSQVDLNVGVSPVALWLVGTAYLTGQQVIGSDNNLYTALSNNTGNNPVTDGGIHWQLIGVAPWGLVPSTQKDVMQGVAWLYLGQCTVLGIQMNYPVGSGPSTDSATRNVFLLPNGYLREAPQDPKAGLISYLGAPSELRPKDWTKENGYITSHDVGPLAYRFIADVVDVSDFDAMFCEGLATRIAIEIVEELTQSGDKLQRLEGFYKQVMGEAREVNGIDNGATQPPMDSYITCRA